MKSMEDEPTSRTSLIAPKLDQDQAGYRCPHGEGELKQLVSDDLKELWLESLSCWLD